ncbi:branched-chain amino acid ABC transporter permease [Candidatus Peregrinibacteria bacterium]|nr:branched-chain amino acid ABC transporter permease [Candidatus Peregrinibacteria bacterium]
MGYLLSITAKFLEGVIISAGAHLTVTVTGIFFLAVPVTYASGAYVMVILQKAGLPLPPAVLLSVLFALGIALFFGFAYTKMSQDSYAVLTLASVVAADALLKSWNSVTGGVLGIAGIARPDFIQTLPALIVGQAFVTVLIIGLEYFLLKSSFGRRLRALKESKVALSSLGFSWKQAGRTVVILAGLLAAISGILTIWRIQYLDPSFSGIPLLLTTLTIAIMAHKPKTLYLAVATFLVVMVPELLRFFDFSSVILGHMRLLLYSVFVMLMIRTLSPKGLSADRSC